MAAFHFESKNAPAESMAAVGGRIAMVGNVNNPVTLFTGSPNQVGDEVRANLAAGVHLVGPECAIPLRTPIANLRAIREAVLEAETGP